MDMFHSITFEQALKLFCCKLGPIVRDQLIGQAIRGKEGVYLLARVKYCE